MTQYQPRTWTVVSFLILSGALDAAEFDSTSGILSFDAVRIGETWQGASLQHRKNLLFELTALTPAAAADEDAVFNADGGNVEAPELLVDDTTALPVELYLLDNGAFMANTLVSTGGKTRNYNREAGIPPMCYTKTDGRHNPCYTCHQDVIVGEGHENRLDDGFLQGDYNFSDLALTNRWRNLFIDRSADVAAISDAEILNYIGQDNYSALAPRLVAQDLDAWAPDLADLYNPELAFAADGFARDGSGWVAFNYKPLPSTFWPTNGSTDDVMIRLPESFRRDAEGADSKPVYQANLAIVEAAIKNLPTLSLPGLDESAVGADLDGDGEFGTAYTLQRPDHYVGAASNVSVVTYLYPQGTEFLHTVRYIGIDQDGAVYNAPRMKEVRYMRKFRFYNKATVGGFYAEEQFEKEQGSWPYFEKRGDIGLVNNFGWELQGFIEDQDGELRPQNYEETFFCMGCHSNLGSTIDKVFAFARKVDGAEGWGYIDLRGMPDAPSKGESEGEFKQYLRRVGGGDEFRQNGEMIERWFQADGRLDESAVDAAADVYELITPSRERALTLNKAYRVIVREQSYIRGRDATVTPARNVFEAIDLDTVPVLPAELHVKKDIRLDW